jgi:hypothetical protein
MYIHLALDSEQFRVGEMSMLGSAVNRMMQAPQGSLVMSVVRCSNVARFVASERSQLGAVFARHQQTL